MFRFASLLLIALLVAVDARSAEPRDLSPALEKLRAEHGLPGCALAVVEQGKITALGAAGLRRADAEVRVTTDDVWHIGSCTKSMSAVLAGVMVDAGKLRWEQSVADALPEMPCDPAWRAITVWEVVTHCTGLRLSSLAPEWRKADRDTFARMLLGTAPPEPRGKSVYSNAGYALLGAILERAAGESYETLLQRHIFAKLELKSAGVGPAATPGQLDQPWGHRRRDGRLVPVEPIPANHFPPVLAPAGCVHLSLREFARYAHWFATNDPPLVTPATFARLHTPPEGTRYAGGAWESELPARGGQAWCHTGHMGGSFATFYASPACTVVCVFNQEGGSWDWLGDVLIDGVLKRLAAPGEGQGAKGAL